MRISNEAFQKLENEELKREDIRNFFGRIVGILHQEKFVHFSFDVETSLFK